MLKRHVVEPVELSCNLVIHECWLESSHCFIACCNSHIVGMPSLSFQAHHSTDAERGAAFFARTSKTPTALIAAVGRAGRTSSQSHGSPSALVTSGCRFCSIDPVPPPPPVSPSLPHTSKSSPVSPSLPHTSKSFPVSPSLPSLP